LRHINYQGYAWGKKTLLLSSLSEEGEEMIEFYRPVDCHSCANVEEALKEMVIAHKVITVPANEISTSLPPGTSLPAIKDGQQIITGPAEIKKHIKKLEKFVERWRRFQSDSCYIGEDDEDLWC
jgi:hypothetical protein